MRALATTHDIGTERSALSCILADNACMDDVGDIIAAEDFYAKQHREFFGAMLALHTRNIRIDLAELRMELNARGKLTAAGGDEALLELHDFVPHTTSAEVYAKRIRALSTVRKMVDAAMGIVSRSREPIEDVDAFLDEAEAALHGVAINRREDARAETMREIIPRVIESMIERPKAGEVRGARTGLAMLDTAISGLQQQHLIVLAGRPGMGKSALAGAMAMSVARTGPVLVWTGEMAKEEWAERMLSSESMVDGDRIRSGRWSPEDWRRIVTASHTLVASPITVEDTPSISLWQLRSKARRMRSRDGLALIVADYMQLMRSGENFRSREQEVAAVSRGLKSIAKELRVPVLALAQLNRNAESSSDKRPSMGDLRESGQIEQDADAILLLFREGYYDKSAPDDVAEIIVAKQRGGRTCTVKALFDPKTVRWANLAVEDEAPASYDDEPPPLGPEDFSDDEGWR